MRPGKFGIHERMRRKSFSAHPPNAGTLAKGPMYSDSSGFQPQCAQLGTSERQMGYEVEWQATKEAYTHRSRISSDEDGAGVQAADWLNSCNRAQGQTDVFIWM